MDTKKQKFWCAKIIDEYCPNGFDSWLFSSLDKMLNFLKNYLRDEELIDDEDEFYEELVDVLNNYGMDNETLNDGKSLEVFEVKLEA